MFDRERAWLLAQAASMTASVTGAVPIEQLLAEHHIEVNIVVGRGPAILRIKEPIGYTIDLPRHETTPYSPSSRERRVLGHELGHALLIDRFNLRPTTSREIHMVETICDDFAGRLLVPDRILNTDKLRRWSDIPRVIRTVASKNKVPMVTVAHRLSQLHPKLYIALLRPLNTELKATKLRVVWSTGFDNDLDLHRARHVDGAHWLSSLCDRRLPSEEVVQSRGVSALKCFPFGQLNQTMIAIYRQPSATSPTPSQD